MSIYKSAVNKPVTTMMVFTAIILFGLYSMTKIPIDLYPDMEMPAISVMTVYAGANAADIEENITKPIENSLTTVDKLKEISSTSKDNLSIVSLEFEWGSDLDVATNDIRDALEMVLSDLPDDCERPTIYKFSTSMMPIIFYTITADESYNGLEKLIDDKVVNSLNRVDGIASVFLSGAPERVVYVDVDAKKMDAYHLTIEGIGNVIAAANVDMPAGSVRMGRTDYQLRVEGEFDESDEIRNLVVGSQGGRNIYVKDVATVNDTLKDVTVAERSNGKPGLRMMVMKQSGANTVAVAKGVKARLAELQPTLPPDIKIQEVYDSSTFIKQSIGNLSSTLLFALLFVTLVVLFFLGRWRATFIIVLTIPISLIVSLIYLALTGSSINIISLSSLSIAIGMVVDDAIVVLENITKHIERGARPREAAIYATNEVWVSVIVTTLVVVAVFLPLTTLSGMAGIMFKELGWIVTITVCTSTAAAISLTPMLSSKLLRLRDKDAKLRGYSALHARFIEPALNRLDVFYERLLRKALNNKKKIVVISVVCVLASFYLFKFVGMDFMPQSDESRFTATIELGTGLRVEETLVTTEKLERLLAERYPEVTVISSSTGADDEGGFSALFGNNGTNTISLTVRLKDLKDRDRSVFEIAEDFRGQLAAFPEIIDYTVSTQGTGGGGQKNNVSIEIYGYDLNTTNRVAEDIKRVAAGVKGARDIEISRKKDKPELQINLDKEKLAQHNLTTATVAAALRNRVAGFTCSKFRELGDEYDIIVRLEEDYRNKIESLEDISLQAPDGAIIKLDEIGDVREYWGPPNIERKRRERVVKVDVTPVGVSLGQLAAGLKSAIDAEVDVPGDIMIVYAGAFEDQQETFGNMVVLLLLIVMLVFVVMASQFESFSKPFIIMMAIPFSFTGVVLALLMTGTTLNMIAALGAILLVGIVVKNGIVLVDYINLMRDRGLELNEAIALSGRSRLRPVLMTTATTILGMLPMALSVGEGSEMWTPMGITVIGGLTVSTVITLIIVPVLYAMMARHGERDKQNKLRQAYTFMEDNR
ncbi:MAG: efflux RND transporter permease subunit [Bacteroidales bacterium]|nr:efflux RND transporter permease subunit [Bacteroidales bacterium]